MILGFSPSGLRLDKYPLVVRNVATDFTSLRLVTQNNPRGQGPSLLALRLSLASLAMIVSTLPRTWIRHLPDEQDGVGFDVTNQEDERAAEFHKSPEAGLVS